MPLVTIVEDYLFAALKRAVVEEMEDGTLAAYVPEIRGLVAFGADTHECARELYGLLEEWVQLTLRNGHEVPIIDGIDLNSESAQILASYHRAPERPAMTGEFLENEDEFEAAFDREDAAY